MTYSVIKITAVIAGIACTANTASAHMTNAFDASSVLISGQTQKFVGGQFGTTQKVRFPVVLTNAGGAYNKTDFRYTAPVAGMYGFTTDVSFAMPDQQISCEITTSFIIQNPDNTSATARFVAADIVMTAETSGLPDGYRAIHHSGTMWRRLNAGDHVGVFINVSAGCNGEVHSLQGAHFSGGKM